MQRDLLIPYAINQATLETVSAKELEDRTSDWRDTIRLDATLDHNTAGRRITRYLCPTCSQSVYPHAPLRPGGRYFWSHRPRSAEMCPLAIDRPLKPDQINRLIFNGRQEGEAHKDLVSLLCRLALADPQTVDASLKIGEYERPTPEMASEFPHGRFPDVAFSYGQNKVVLEAQLATIALNGINGRRAYYDRLGSALLWITRNFDPSNTIRASLRDILADQRGLILSVDQEVESLSAKEGVFHLRAWIYEYTDRQTHWSNRVVPLTEAIEMARPQRWSDRFKARFVETYDGQSYKDVEIVIALRFANELLEQLHLPGFSKWGQEADDIVCMIGLLISLEIGRPIGSGHPKLISLANSFDRRDRERYRSLVLKAVEHWRPELLAQRSMRDALDRSRLRLIELGEAPYGRNSIIGRLRAIVFPDWKLSPIE